MANADVLNTCLGENWLAIFLVTLTVVLNYQRFGDYVVRFKYTGLIFLVLKISFRIISGSILNIVLVPVLLAGYVVQWILSTANYIYVLTAIDKNVTRASGMDAVFGLDTAESPAFASVIFKMNDKPDIENFRKYFTEKVLNVRSSSGQIQFPKFKQLYRNYGGYYYWKDDANFDINNHIYLENISEMYPKFSSKKGVSGIDLICRYLEDHGLEEVKDGNAPQWEFRYLQTGAEEFFCNFRFHHSFGDGVCMRRFLLEYLSDDTSTDTLVIPTPSLPFRILRFFWAISLIPYAVGVLIYKGSCNPMHGKKLNGKKYFVAVPEIPFKLVTDIKRKTKTSVPAILFSAITNAFGKIFQKRSSKIPYITACYPLGVTNPKAELKMENTFFLGLASLPVPDFKSLDGKLYQTNSSLSNLFKTDLALRGAHEDATIMAYYYLMLLYVNVIPIFLGRIVSSCGGMTVGLTNFPGFKKPLMIMKQRLGELKAYPPDRAPLGMTVAFVTSDAILRTSITVDGALVNSREEAEEFGNNWFAEIKRLAKELDIKDPSE